MVEAIQHAHKEKVIFWTLFGILLLSLGFYMYCINATVRNVVAQENAETDASRIALEIGNKEFQYISMRNSITIESAYQLGFKDAEEKTFLKTDSKGLVSYVSKEL